MSEVEIKEKTKTILKDDLYSRFDWYYKNFLPAIQNAGDEFFSDYFSFKLISVSKNVNVLLQGEDYFVTKIKIDKQHDVFFRCSTDAVKIILDKILGSTKKFNLTNITELEAKIISSFNNYAQSAISKFLLAPPPKTQKRKNFDTVHLTFFIREKNSPDGAKIIVSLPEVLLNPVELDNSVARFDIGDFKSSKVEVNIRVGTTKFSLKDLKSLETEDIVIFENSHLDSMKLIYEKHKKDFKVSPNPGLITSINNSGGHNMEENSLSQDLWDNIQVEMGAEFEKVKITLGELKSIEQGLVVDISSVYNNKISLKVENKTIAKGELVIINDRYGVRIDEVFASEKNQAENISQEPEAQSEEEFVQEEASEPHTESGDEEFDYSDFELDDQDI